MRLGIDFGTTRTVVAVSDRGNYPVVSFQSETGDVQPWHPSLLAAREGRLSFGLQAQSHLGEPGWFFLRSMKRLMAGHGPESTVNLAGDSFGVLDLLTGYLKQLRADLLERSNVEIESGESLDAAVAVPANANTNQRFLTMEAFRRAGFRVVGMINEPSAAGIEYAQRCTGKEGRTREYLVVYDLGGGTFDASVIGMKSRQYDVVTDEGISRLGGDDFDELLLEMAVAEAPGFADVPPPARFHLLEECRRQKEALHPNTRRIVVDLGRGIQGAPEVTIPVEQYYARCVPLVEKSITAMENAVECASSMRDFEWNSVAAVYLVGGSSDLPVVARMLRERYGRRVRRSPYPYSATAIGLAIAADAGGGHALRERFTRYFGVWREAESGRRIIFDPIFAKGTPLPGPSDPPLCSTRGYQPMHNIGHFRYLECSRISEDGQPCGDMTPWKEILFEMDPELSGLGKRLDETEVRRVPARMHQMIREEYRCDSLGMIEVRIVNETAGYERSYRL